MFRFLIQVIRRDMLLFSALRNQYTTPLIFFIMIVSLFPIVLGTQYSLLVKIAPAMIWVSIIFSLLMSLTAVFQMDYEEGILEQYLLSPYPLSWLIFCKAVVHNILFGIPLWILAILFGICLNMNFMSIECLAITLAFGIPTLSLLGILMAALTLGLPQGGMLLAILALPLMIPVLVFGVGGVQSAMQGNVFSSEVLFLIAFFIVVWVLGPMLVSAALKTSIE